MNTPTIVSRSDVRARSYQMGAAHERQSLKAYLKRAITKMDDGNWREKITGALDWIEERTKRFNAKKGGLGRKRKAAK